MIGILTIVGSGGGGGDDDSGSEPVIEQVAAPQITPASGKFISEQAIRITCATEEVSIRYTTDNTNPSETAGTLIPQGTTFTLSRSATVKAIAYKSGMTASPITSVSYTFQQWTWVSGDSTTDEAGVYGTSSDKPGARDSSVSWTDPDGNFWLFGGLGYDTDGISGNLNDLWKFDGAKWEMVSGDTAYGQPGEYNEPYQPGARYWSASWTDTDGNLWLFGGFGLDTNGDEGDLNDLWKFDRSSEEWEWVSGYDTYGQQGESDLPGARDSAVSWTDLEGNLWLFGGYGLDMYGEEGNLNDLWEFDTTSEEWTLVSGSDAIDEEGNYEPGETNYPGARYGSVSWTDTEGNMWLFGGAFYYDDGEEYSYNFNDLWKFDTATEEWTWVSGSDSPDESGVYGTIGTAGESNMPGARSYSLSWIDSSGSLWLFGGLGYDSSGSYGDMNDLWKFNPSTAGWTWVSGSNSAGHSGVYGSKGTPSVSNTPGARTSAVSWIDSDDNLWLFGGYYYDNDDGYEYDLNDLWKFEP